MNNLITRTIVLSTLSAAAIFTPITANAELHSKSRDIVVMQANDLPETAQLPANSFFLHPDNAGSTYLYIEQQQGARLAVFDVTDPSRIRLASTTALANNGAFDFVGALNEQTELVRFRDGERVAVLDLHKATKPQLRTVEGLTDITVTDPLGPTALLVVNQRYAYVPAVARDYQVVDTAGSNAPALLTTIKDVKHRVENGETGTTFLLGSNGLTVVRQLSVEREYQIRQIQMQGN